MIFFFSVTIFQNSISNEFEVYTSWIDGAISNYNTDFYYQSRDYSYACYQERQYCTCLSFLIANTARNQQLSDSWPYFCAVHFLRFSDIGW